MKRRRCNSVAWEKKTISGKIAGKFSGQGFCEKQQPEKTGYLNIQQQNMYLGILV